MENLENLTAYLPIGEGTGNVILTLAMVIVGFVIALYSYKIFRVTLSVMGAVIFGFVGESYVAPAVITTASEGMFNYSALVTLGCALVGAILMGVILKLALFVCGGAVGYLSGGFIAGLLAPSIEFFATETGVLVAGIAAAVILGVLSIFLFKLLYILGTGLAGMYIVGVALVGYAMQGSSEIVVYAPYAIAVLGGLIATVVQYKRESY